LDWADNKKLRSCDIHAYFTYYFIVIISFVLIKRIGVIGINSFYGTVITWGKSEEFRSIGLYLLHIINWKRSMLEGMQTYDFIKII
jgi:hypothetical protein